MNVDTLTRRARAGTLEVEHILEAAVERTPGLADRLAQLSIKYAWSASGTLPNGSLVAPMAKWAQIASAYATNGFDGLRVLASNLDDAPFILSLVSLIKTPQSVAFILDTYQQLIANPAKNIETSVEISSALNLMLSFKDAVAISTEDATAIETFLITLFPLVKTETHKAIVILTFRGVGRERALNLVQSIPSFSSIWESSRKATLRALKKRVNFTGNVA
ncbi:MAG: hypothetical protein LBU11_12680 [Zoogloeaceae bacterium]|jgi:predicted protein tyrosine phosphatase|nr:hypothetical protein [Zoogloeaceae bacterium]